MSEIQAPERVPAASLPPSMGALDGQQLSDSIVTVTPTQVRRPWRSTGRTIFQLVLSLATLIPYVVGDVWNDADTTPVMIGQLVVVSGIITRLMALPQVEEFLRTFLPFLAAAPSPSSAGARKLDERGLSDVAAIFIVALIAVVVLVVFVPWGARGR